MGFLGDLLRFGGMGVSGFTIEGALLALLLAFVLGQLAAWIYVFTHSGLSYSRSFVQSIILLTIIVSLAMMVIGSNIVIAFGLIGALAVIRFRNILKDTRDTAFIFFSLTVGMATGTGAHQLAIVGTLLFSAVLLYLYWVGFGSRHRSDGFVRFQITSRPAGMVRLDPVLNRHCLATRLISERFTEGEGGEIAYRLRMRDPRRSDEFVAELQGLDGVTNVTLVLQEEQAEI